MRTTQQTKNLQDWYYTYWPAIPADRVVPGLCTWKTIDDTPECGTLACFGGFVAMNPEAQRQGVEVGYEGVPIMGMTTGYKVAERFFGDDRLFFPRGCHDSDDFQPSSATDHQIVSARLRWALEH